MKKNWNILLLVLLLCLTGGLLGSCTDEMEGKSTDGGDKITMRVQFSTKADGTAAIDPEKLNDNEYRIRSIRLYAFDGETLDNMVYESGLDNVTGIATVDIDVTPGNKTFYVVVNEPDDDAIHSALGLANHPNGIKQVQYSIADYLNSNVNALSKSGDYFLPMYKEQSANISKTSTNLTIGVDRAVARIDVYMIKAAGITTEAKTDKATLKVERSIGTGYIATDNISSTDPASDNFFDMNNPVAATLGNYTADYTGYEKIYSFYVPEQNCTDEAYRLKFTLGGITWGGKQMATPYNTFYLGNDASNSAGAVLNKIARNTVYRIYCRIKPTTKDVTFNVVTMPWGVAPTQDEPTEKGEINMVNCYMVAPGGSVNIPVQNVYRFWAWSDDLATPDPISKEMEVVPEIIWTDTENLITSVDLLNIPNLTDNKDHAKIRVQTSPGKQGNAVIGMRMKSEDGTLESGYRWSWHVWVTDYNPNINNDSYNGQIVMQRSLGALIDYYEKNGYAKGLIYQWGRKDPLPGTKGWSDENIDLFGKINNFVSEDISSEMNLVNSIQKPYIFYSSPNEPYDWYTTDESKLNNNLWLTTDGKKTIYDPCPEGWRVPLSTIGWDKDRLNNTNFPIEDMGRRGNGVNLGFFSGGGYRDYFDGFYTGLSRNNWSTDYWFADTNMDIITTFTVHARLVPQYVIGSQRALGYSVRCVKE